MCGRSPKESNLHSAFARGHRPFAFVAVINQRSKHQRQIAGHGFVVASDDNLMSGSRKDSCEVTDVNARNVEKDAADVLRHPRRYGVTTKTRPITTDDGVLGDRTTFAAQIGQYDDRHFEASHLVTAPNAASNLTTADWGCAESI